MLYTYVTCMCRDMILPTGYGPNSKACTPSPSWAVPLPGWVPHPSPMHAAPLRRLWEARPAPSYPHVLLILLPCSSHCLLPFPPPKDFQVHLNVILSVGLFPPGAEPSFLLAGFCVPFRKPYSSNSAPMLYPSCFYKDLSFQLPCAVCVGGATSCLSSDSQGLTQGRQSSWWPIFSWKKVIKRNTIFIYVTIIHSLYILAIRGRYMKWARMERVVFFVFSVRGRQ